MKIRIALLFLFALVSVASAQIGRSLFSFRGTAPATFLSYNLVTNGGATCNGSADDGGAFDNFKAFAIANQGSGTQVRLTIPAGLTCCFNSFGSSAPGVNWTQGIKDVVLLGNGSTLSQCGFGQGPPFFGALGMDVSTASYALFQTTSAGASTVTLITSGDTSKFSAGDWVILSSLDLQGFGYPPNPGIFEYMQIQSIGAGTLTFASPLQYSYRSTYPVYGPDPDNWLGGPATVFKMRPSWDFKGSFQDLTLNFGTDYGIYSNGRDVTWSNVTIIGDICLVPSANKTVTWNNVTGTTCGIEVDKMIDTWNISNVNMHQFTFQSSSPNQVTITGLTLTYLNGTPRKINISNSSISSFQLAPNCCGVTIEATCTTCTIGEITQVPTGVNNVDTSYTMSGGVLSKVICGDSPTWAVLGGYYYFGVTGYEYAVPFRVTDITQTGGFCGTTHIATTLASSFPISGTNIQIRAHPVLSWTCTACTGSEDALDASRAAPATPFGQYTRRVYTGADSAADGPVIPIWGALVSYKVTVNTVYSGALGALTIEPGPGGNNVMLGATKTVFDPIVNTKLASPALRTILQGSASGGQSGDSNITAAGAIWFVNLVQFQKHFSSNIVADPTHWPSVTIELITDQGIP